MVETRGSRRFALLFFGAAFLILFVGRWVAPVNHVALGAAAPFNAVASAAAGTVGDMVTGVVQGPGLRSEDLRLRRAMAKILQQNVLLQEKIHDDALIRRMAHFADSHTHLDLLGARVIGHDPNDLADFILINKGTRDGLQDGMTVLDDGGYFVGAISDVSTSMSKVLLMTSPSSSVGALDVRSRATGLVEGRYGARPTLQWVLTGVNVHKGDFIVTSGQYELFPRALLLGQVVGVHRRAVSDFQTADVQPSADFGNLELVQVVRNFVRPAPSRVLPILPSK
ncbi:MAG TPA: rod shape-determining protein MreC [Chloroflexota bacterium]